MLDNTTRYISEKQNVFYPDTIFFCGELIPMTEPDVQAKFEKELAIYTKYKASTRLLIARANKWFPQFEQELKKQQIPQDLRYLVAVESAFTNVISNKGAVGFWQIRKITGRSLDLVINEQIDERLHPIKATKAAGKYFKMAYNIFGNWTLAAASYNLGIAGLQRRISQQNTKSYFDLDLNKETSRYIFKALAFKEVYENASKYDIYPQLSDTPKMPKQKLTAPIADLSQYALEINSHPDSIRKYNPWILGNTIPLINGESVTILAPLVKLRNIKVENSLPQDNIVNYEDLLTE